MLLLPAQNSFTFSPFTLIFQVAIKSSVDIHYCEVPLDFNVLLVKGAPITADSYDKHRLRGRSGMFSFYVSYYYRKPFNKIREIISSLSDGNP